MPARTIRRSLWALAVAAVLIAVLAVAVPYIASTRIVRDRIAEEIGAWSGYTVRIEGSPRVEVWPRFKAVLRDVSFTDVDAAGERPVGTVDRVDIELSALAAMRGDAVITSARLERPALWIGADPERGIWQTLAGKGRIRAAIDKARDAVARQADPGTPKPPMPTSPFGSIRVEDGKILLDDGSADGAPLVTGIAGAVEWPTLDGAGSVEAQGIWQGETIKVVAESAQPMLLFAGGSAPVTLSVVSALGSASFAGVANLAGEVFVDGRMTAATASFGRLAGWAGVEPPEWEKLQTVTISGAVSGDPRRLKLDGASLQVEGGTGAGAAELATREGRIAVSGSLAFDTLNLGTLFEVLLPLATQDRGAHSAPALQWLRGLVLDLRLSASNATAGPFAMAEVAAAVRLQDEFDSFDILDARLLGGELEARLRFDRKADGTVMTLRASAARVDGEAIGAALGMTRLVPSATGSMTVDIAGRGADIQSAMKDAKGKFSARFGPGTLSAFDLPAFLDRSRKGGFFPLDEVSAASLDIDAFDIKGTVAGGVASIDQAEARFGQRRMWISGLASYADRSLALTGGVGPLPAGGEQPTADAAFFVGGSWSAPFISPAAGGN
ncbi:AsmA-like C-terminal region-containing protein [Mesorhizobium sp. LHD-90]|uniref:AsmA family protein n=1 Tax=Mesorhizobium sp. LHD-90 TaxID=3071414 RepID=UPI0027E1A78C|nr:AsmA-like C-terminal region-containing protein [Mesorhizobium sp. LHD-90]MDQ6435154.1 AsmA-like C-terminal region-containing protein [Mesorhizobium sp. LHD-90]